MNLKSIITGVALVSLAMVTQAATFTNITLDWQFNSSANPSSPNDSLSTTNPSGAVASCTIVSDTYLHYYFNAYPTTPPGGYGTERGLWDTINGQFNLTWAGTVTPIQPLTYTLDIFQFVGDPNFLPGTIQITPLSLGAPISPTSRRVTDVTSFGNWVDDRYTWTALPSAGPLALTIGPASSGGELLIDEITWNVMSVVPEPGAAALGALGMLGFGMRAWMRRKA